MRHGAAAVALALLASCGGEAPPAAKPPALPADHPPLAAPAAPAQPLPPDTVLATAGEARVTVADVDAAIAAMPSPDKLEFTSLESLRELVDSLLDRRLMAAAARAAGESGDDEVLATAWLDAELGQLPPPAEADIERYFREHPAEFTEPARVNVTRITAATREEAERAREALARGAAVPGAEQLWLQDGPQLPEPTRIALALQPGEVSAVLPAAAGFLVMRAEAKVPARQRLLAEVRAGIRAGLESGRRQAAMAGIRARLRQGVAVSFDEAALKAWLAAAAPAA